MKVAVLLCFVGLAAAGVYDGYKIYTVTPQNEAEIHALLNMEEHDFFVDFFDHSEYPGKPAIFMVSAVDALPVKEHLEKFGMKIKVLHEDVQKVVDAEVQVDSMLKAARPYKFGDLQSYDFGQYHRFADIDDFMQRLHEENAEFTEIIEIGRSFEDRPLKIIKIGAPSETPKPAFYMHCNTHAREFITAGTCVFIMNLLVEEFKAGNPDFQPYLNDMDWYILPVHNPDGYEYAHTTSRYWRKTRSGPHGGRSFGVDPNRNWDARFGGAGASSSPSSDTYHGPSAFSEPETRAVSEFVLANRDTIKAFIGIHSFTQLWLIPYSYARNTQPADGAELNQMASDVVAAIRGVHGQTYRDGTAANILYSVTGGSFDWAKEKAGIKWSYSPESRPRRAFGLSGFNPNPNQIIPNAEELFGGFRVIADRILSDAKKN